MNKFKFITLVVIFINLSLSLMAEIYITHKVNGEAITNIDIKKESQYLIALNNQLKNLKRERIEKIAEESLIKEKIKKIELTKYFEFNQNKSILDIIIKEFYTKLSLDNEKQFEKYLGSYDLKIEEVRTKLEIETLWNKLIFEKYKNQINIDEKELESKILKKKELINEKIYQLSEIIFKKDNNKTIVQITEEIKKSVSEVGFKNTANIFSLSDSSKFGGNIGWVKEKNLSKKIYKEINTLKIGDLSEAIQVGNNFLILKINNIKIEKIKTDKNKELQKIIEFEKNRQLNQFSMIYFNKIQINTNVEKL